ncbi:coiled-coil domain-containing protein 167 isoform X2 [Corythoichthys intestinalis]|uniref:coiled-coil domain-containing protein 167 isoform X2 n=1 Tax=Corythoichthys intestinalis TaxID=161448 RepID=UPI0025A646F7|nr:coiled-coil domain-containing protein 167 isoform X2 [Corythoichthys intestinalis]
MVNVKDRRRENASVASEIDRLEERRARCHDNLEMAEFRSRNRVLSEEERQQLEIEMAVIIERVRNLDKELQLLRRANRKNTLLDILQLDY